MDLIDVRFFFTGGMLGGSEPAMLQKKEVLMMAIVCWQLFVSFEIMLIFT
jgi:hypothetical protein